MSNNMKKSKYVTTINGEKLLKKNTRYIEGNYYKIGDTSIKDSGDCYLINDKYYREETGYIIYDYRKNEYVISNQSLLSKGVVDFDSNKEPVFGYFSKVDNKLEALIKIESTTYPLLNETIINKSDYLEDLSNGIYYHRKIRPSKSFVFPAYCDQEHKVTLDYDSRKSLKTRSKLFNELFDSNNISELVSIYSESLKGLSFGLEFETFKGYVPERICNELGLIPLRDGSISGLEYVTIPLEGKKGLEALIQSITQLRKRTEYNKDCSLHLHIGNIPRTEEFILALFKTLCFVQDEIFELFPLYKKYNFGYKRKHYTKPFNLNQTLLLMDSKITPANIKSNFNILFESLSMGIPYSNYNNNLDNVNSHPSDPNGSSKWQIRSRYMAHNLIPLIFGNKETVEFRIHTPTYDVNKIINYLFICGSIVNYAKLNTVNILENPKYLRYITLNDILYSLGIKSSLVDNLSNYIRERKSFVYSKNRNSEIHFNEDEYIPSKNVIDWSNTTISKKSKRDHDSLIQRLKEIQRGYNAQILEPEEVVANVGNDGLNFEIPDEF